MASMKRAAAYLYVVMTLWLACMARAAAEPPPATRPADWFRIDRLDEHTYALVEPQYWQFNVNYLIVGSERALLFDTGPGVYAIRDVVASLTSLPIIVVPSHLHFDHVGRIGEFDDIALPDLPALRAQARDGMFTATLYQVLLAEGARFPVTRWLADGADIELGGRVIRVVHVPGHTPDSVALIDGVAGRVFIGDLVNRDITLANVPGADVRAMAASVQRLLAEAPPGSDVREAHSDQPLTWEELQEFAGGLDYIAQGQVEGEPACLAGLPMVRHLIGAFPVLVPGPAQLRLQPLDSPVQELEWLSEDCLAPD